MPLKGCLTLMIENIFDANFTRGIPGAYPVFILAFSSLDRTIWQIFCPYCLLLTLTFAKSLDYKNEAFSSKIKDNDLMTFMLKYVSGFAAALGIVFHKHFWFNKEVM